MKRLKPQIRKEQLLDTGLKLARRIGVTKVTREKVAEESGITGASLHYHFGTMAQFRRDLVRRAVAVEDLRVLAQLVVLRDKGVSKIPAELRQKAIESIIQ